MDTVNIHAAKTHLSKLIDKVEHGKEVVISRAGKPVAKIIPYSEPQAEQKPRQWGQWTGKVWYAPDYDQADAEIQKMFEGELENDWKE